MPRPTKTPQEKKESALKRDRVTLGGESIHGFRKTWPKKKANANREYRRKSDELLSKTKTGDSAEDAELMVGDLTATHIKKSVSRRRLVKWGAISLERAIEYKLEKRKETVGRRADSRRSNDAIVRTALTTLQNLNADEAVAVVERIAKAVAGGDPIEWVRLSSASNPLDRAIFVLEQLHRGNFGYWNSLARNKDLCRSYRHWNMTMLRILEKLQRPLQQKRTNKTANEKKVKASLRGARKKKK